MAAMGQYQTLSIPSPTGCFGIEALLVDGGLADLVWGDYG